MIWLRSGVITTWTLTTMSAGAVGFERYKGTLVYLVTARVGPLKAIAAVITSSATFGLLSLPLAWIITWLVNLRAHRQPPASPVPLTQLTIGVLLLWLSCLAMAMLVASLFVLTPNAIAYEELILTPVLITSGILFTVSDPPQVVRIFEYFLPISGAVDLLLKPMPWLSVAPKTLVTLILIGVWFLVAAYLGNKAIKAAVDRATIEVV